MVPGGEGHQYALDVRQLTTPRQRLKPSSSDLRAKPARASAAAVKARDEERTELLVCPTRNAFEALAVDKELAAKADLAEKIAR